ncbi:hypothetical protein ACJX0J_019748, partial [Zea mays]
MQLIAIKPPCNCIVSITLIQLLGDDHRVKQTGQDHSLSFLLAFYKKKIFFVLEKYYIQRTLINFTGRNKSLWYNHIFLKIERKEYVFTLISVFDKQHDYLHYCCLL